MKLDSFIRGEMIDLCVPTKDFAEKSDWYSWFNDKETTRFLDRHGLFPNDSEKQIRFYEENKDTRLLLIVCDKTITEKPNYLGVISLSGIQFTEKQADMAMVLSRKKNFKMIPFFALEAIARITEHAFSVMGLNRINSNHHIELAAGWQQRKEILGYRLEGMRRDGWVKGRETVDVMTSSIVYEDYLRIIEIRGCYWDSLVNMKKRIKRLPTKKFVESFKEFMSNEGGKYYDEVFRL